MKSTASRRKADTNRKVNQLKWSEFVKLIVVSKPVQHRGRLAQAMACILGKRELGRGECGASITARKGICSSGSGSDVGMME